MGPNRGQSPNQRTVRAREVEDAFREQNMLMGQKVAASMSIAMANYHDKFTEPLEARVRYLEKYSVLFWIGQSLQWLRDLYPRLRDRIRGTVELAAAAADGETEVPPPAEQLESLSSREDS